jgi:hypothetical protein
METTIVLSPRAAGGHVPPRGTATAEGEKDHHIRLTGADARPQVAEDRDPKERWGSVMWCGSLPGAGDDDAGPHGHTVGRDAGDQPVEPLWEEVDVRPGRQNPLVKILGYLTALPNKQLTTLDELFADAVPAHLSKHANNGMSLFVFVATCGTDPKPYLYRFSVQDRESAFQTAMILHASRGLPPAKDWTLIPQYPDRETAIFLLNEGLAADKT